MNRVSEKEFQVFLDEHYAILQNVCSMYSDTDDDFHDNMQEVMLQLWRSYSNFDGRSKISTWVYRVALNVCLVQARRKKNLLKKHMSWASEPEIDDLEDKRRLERRSGMLTDAIKKLKEADRAIILLYLEEMSYEEISDITGLTVSNVGVKLNRIRKKLKELING